MGTAHEIGWTLRRAADPLARKSGVLTVLSLLLASCGARSPLPLESDGAARSGDRGSGGTSSAGSDAPGGAGATPAGDAGAAGATTPVASRPALCVFDYDLTLSAHQCAELDDGGSYFCRENTCDTYGWYSQCLSRHARAAVAECVARGAYIGIASHANADACWHDKVLPIISEQQFPEFTESAAYGAESGDLRYPRVDVRANWNCEDCAYTMDGNVSKSNGIRRIMRHYGMDPSLAKDRERVIFWDDTPSNITAVEHEMPEARSVLVPRFTDHGGDGGCGIRQEDIVRGWAE
jgi:hypothetical protein